LSWPPEKANQVVKGGEAAVSSIPVALAAIYGRAMGAPTIGRHHLPPWFQPVWKRIDLLK
jgi:hypothetical protein